LECNVMECMVKRVKVIEKKGRGHSGSDRPVHGGKRKFQSPSCPGVWTPTKRGGEGLRVE